jgi:hypothetical protein
LFLHAEFITKVFSLLGSDRLFLRNALLVPVPVLPITIVFYLVGSDVAFIIAKKGTGTDNLASRRLLKNLILLL